MAGGSEVTDTVTRVPADLGDEATPTELRHAVHILSAESRGVAFAYAKSEYKDEPKSIFEKPEVVPIFKLKATSSNPLRNFIGGATICEDHEKSAFTTK